jgi:hypothetical protein
MKEKLLYWLGALLLAILVAFAQVAGKAAKEHEPLKLPHEPTEPVIENPSEPTESTEPVIEISDPN